MTEVLPPNGDVVGARRTLSPPDEVPPVEQLPTPLLTPLIGSPLLQTFAKDAGDGAFESLDGKLSTAANMLDTKKVDVEHIGKDVVLKLSPKELKELTLDATSLPVRVESPDEEKRGRPAAQRTRRYGSFITNKRREDVMAEAEEKSPFSTQFEARPSMPTRTVSTPPNTRRKQSGRKELMSPRRPPPMSPSKPNAEHGEIAETFPASALPIPPLSIPTFLQLELDVQEPSQLYIQRTPDFPYESSAVKFERLENFLLLPGHLEQTLVFGAAACFDAWLYNLTILPLRFLKALGILSDWWLRSLWKEVCDLVRFVYGGLGRLWRRTRSGSAPTPGATPGATPVASRQSSYAHDLPTLRNVSGQKEKQSSLHAWPEQSRRTRKDSNRKHRRTRSTPSLLMPNHKADLLKGFLIICSSILLLQLDPSRMYHNIRGQSAIKLYVIYNMLEVADKLLGSIGQDILECLFSRETLERNANGRSKILRPFWLFVLSLAYNVVHAAALFYQVISLNVAVNSYSNALLTLLMSNQFVEIKGAVFKKFEKENLFQMCCADVVERFQLILMLLIIAMRNIVEVGGLGFTMSSSSTIFNSSPTEQPLANATATAGIPFSSSAILPKSFNILPSLPTKVLTPFLIVIGSEMLVDWLKYAYINKFNNYRPQIFGQFFDVLAKDYYTNAFGDQNLTRRIGLPVFPLTCLFVRASVQTYQMLAAMYTPSPIVTSSITSLALEEELPTSTPGIVSALMHIDRLFQRALGHSPSLSAWDWKSIDDFTSILTTLSLGLIIYLLLLAFKIVLGMFLLALSRRRYASAKFRQEEKVDADGRRIGGWGQVELGDDRRNTIYEGDERGLGKVRDRDRKGEEAKAKVVDYGRVRRWDMVAKRIW